MRELPDVYRKLLVRIYSNALLRMKSTVRELAESTNMRDDHLEELCNYMKNEKFISESRGEFLLTSIGRKKIKVVFTGGVFDIIHPGHIFALSSAKKIGDALVVVVARDKTVLRNKGRRPLNSEENRLELVKALKFVDVAMLGGEGDIFETVAKVMPDTIALGYDQKYDESELKREAEKHGLSVEFTRLGSRMPDIKSSKISENREIFNEF